MDENQSYRKSSENNAVFDTSKSLLQEIPGHFHQKANVRLWVKRDDLIDPEVSGNKWRKLALNVVLAQHQRKEGILTFGGAYSNHLLATASACSRVGLKSIGIVRGEELTAASNPNLRRCAELGMDLIFISRTQYDCRCEASETEMWKARYASYLLVPEGGANYHGMIGCQEIMQELPFTADHVFLAQGTTATSCGVLVSLPEKAVLHAVPVLKGFDTLAEMRALLLPVLLDAETVDDYLKQVVVHSDAHFGGYGKWTSDLEQFIYKVRQAINLPLDKIYTGKAFYALMQWLEKTDFTEPVHVVFIHTGGLLNG